MKVWEKIALGVILGILLYGFTRMSGIGSRNILGNILFFVVIIHLFTLNNKSQSFGKGVLKLIAGVIFGLILFFTLGQTMLGDCSPHCSPAGLFLVIIFIGIGIGASILLFFIYQRLKK